MVFIAAGAAACQVSLAEVYSDQSSLMDSLPQEKKKKTESENSLGQKKSLQTKVKTN